MCQKFRNYSRIICPNNIENIINRIEKRPTRMQEKAQQAQPDLFIFWKQPGPWSK